MNVSLHNFIMENANLGDKVEESLAKAGLMPGPNDNGETCEKRKKTRREQAQRKKRKLDNEAGEMWVEGQSDKVNTFLMSAPVIPGKGNKSKQLVIVPLAGLEWEGRKLLYQLLDMVVDIATHRVELKSLVPARALDTEDWAEIPIPASPRTSEEQEYLHQILDDLDKEVAGVQSVDKQVKKKQSRGRKKKQLQAGRGDQHITSFFKHDQKTTDHPLTGMPGPVQGVACSNVEGMGKIVNIATGGSSHECGGDLANVVCEGGGRVFNDSVKMGCEHGHGQSGVTGDVRERIPRTHTASFKQLGNENFKRKTPSKLASKEAKNQSIHSKQFLNLGIITPSKKRGQSDLDLDSTLESAENNSEQCNLTDSKERTKKRRFSENESS